MVTIVMYRRYGSDEYTVATFPVFIAGESVADRETRWTRELETAEEKGAGYAKVVDGDLGLLVERTMEQMRNVLLPEFKASYGKRPDGTRVHNGGCSPLLSATRVEGRGEINLQEVSIWHLQLPRGRRGDQDWSWWLRHVEEKLFAGRGVTFAAVDGGRLTVRVEAPGKEWMSCFRDWDLSLKFASKFLKRAKVATRSMPFRTAMAANAIRVALVRHPREHAKRYDGLVLIDAALWRKIIEALSQGLDMGPDGENLDKLSGAGKELVQKRRSRLREEQVERAMKTLLGNLRIIMPVGVLEEHPLGGLIKGNYLVVEGLKDQNGEPCDILTSPENIKTELGGGDVWNLGIEPQHVKTRARTSTQQILNMPALFPEGDVLRWAIQEVYRVLESIIGGRLEECHRMAAEAADAEVADLDEETTSVLYRFREWIEEVLGTGHDARHAPNLALDAYRALVKRMVSADACRINVPVPYSMSIQILSQSMVELAGYRSPVTDGHIDIRPDLGYAVVTDRDWEEDVLPNCGQGDQDDHWALYLRRTVGDDGYVVVAVRHPNDIGEYSWFTPLNPEVFRPEYDLVRTEGAFSVGDKPKPVPTLDMTKMPKQPTRRGVKVVHPEGFGKGKEYPKGYRKEDVFNDLLHALGGHSPGFPINARMLLASVGVELQEMPCTLEEIVDTFVQGGSQEAMNAISAEAEKWVVQALEAAKASGRKIDTAFWFLKSFKAPEGCGIDVGALLRPGIVTRLMAGIVGLTKTTVRNPAKQRLLEANLPANLWGDAEGKSLLALGEKVLVKHLLKWQEAPPGLLAYRKTPEGQRKGAGAQKEFMRMVHPAWVAFASRPSRTRRLAYVEAARGFVERRGPAELVERMAYTGSAQRLQDDKMVWNQGVAELVIPWLRDNRPCLADRALYRVVVYRTELAAEYLHEACGKALWGKEDGREVDEVLEALKRYAHPEEGKTPTLSALIQRLVKEGRMGVGLGERLAEAFRDEKLGLRTKVARILEILHRRGIHVTGAATNLPLVTPPVDPASTVRAVEVAEDEQEAVELAREEAKKGRKLQLLYDFYNSEAAVKFRKRKKLATREEIVEDLWTLAGGKDVADVVAETAQEILTRLAEERQGEKEEEKPEEKKEAPKVKKPLRRIETPGEGTMWVLRIWSTNGKFGGTVAELWGPTEGGEPTHLHVYNYKLAMKGFTEGAFKLPETVETVSYDPGQNPEPTEEEKILEAKRAEALALGRMRKEYMAQCLQWALEFVEGPEVAERIQRVVEDGGLDELRTRRTQTDLEVIDREFFGIFEDGWPLISDELDKAGGYSADLFEEAQRRAYEVILKKIKEAMAKK